MTTRDPQSPIASEIAEFIDFFKQELAGIEFPDVDANKLDALAEAVCKEADELADLTERVRVARESLLRAQGELRRQSERGLAYIQIYAGGNPELAEAIERLALARERSEDKPARRRKAKSKSKSKSKASKSDAPTGELPFDGKSSEAA